MHHVMHINVRTKEYVAMKSIHTGVYVQIKFVSDLRQVGGFLRVLRFPPPIKLTAKI
jgi:hypothetical protein